MVKDVGVYCRLIIQSIIIVITTQHTAEENLGQKRAGSNQVFNFKRAADWPKVKPESSRIMLAQEVTVIIMWLLKVTKTSQLQPLSGSGTEQVLFCFVLEILYAACRCSKSTSKLWLQLRLDQIFFHTKCLQFLSKKFMQSLAS